jgi:hypothetical protein
MVVATITVSSLLIMGLSSLCGATNYVATGFLAPKNAEGRPTDRKAKRKIGILDTRASQ